MKQAAKIHWHLMFRVGNEKKARRQLEQAGGLIGQDFVSLDCKAYWKIPELWECDTESSVGPGSMAELVVASLSQANCLARGWYVLGPHFGECGELESFSGIFSAKSGMRAIVSSLEWAHFELNVEAASPAGRSRNARVSAL